MRYEQELAVYRKRRERIRALLAKGWSAQAIADKEKISRQRVYQLKNKDGNGKAI